jgi:hypothetical protein
MASFDELLDRIDRHANGERMLEAKAVRAVEKSYEDLLSDNDSEMQRREVQTEIKEIKESVREASMHQQLIYILETGYMSQAQIRDLFN